MKILYASFCYLPNLGGGEIQLHGVARRLCERGHAARVVCQWSRPRTDWVAGATWKCDPPASYAWEGIPVERLGFSLARRAAMLPWARLYPRLPALTSRALTRLLKRPLAAVAGQPDVVHAIRIGQEFLPRAAFELARSRGVPFVLNRHFHPPSPNPLHAAYDALAREADAVVALTPHERDLLVETRGVRPERVHVIGVGPVLAPDWDVGAFRAAWGIDAPYVLFLGRQVRHKGYRELLAAARDVWTRHPEVHFVFVGQPDPRAEEVFAAESDPRIRHLGTLDEAAKTAALAGCELLCVPSTAESFGVVYVEAGMLRKPVVACRIGPVASVIEDGRTGLLCEQEPGPIADRIGWLLDRPEEARAMGEAGREAALARYTWKAIVDQTEALYEALV